MRFGLVGDIVGRIGRQQVVRYLKQAREDYCLDWVVANGENASHGFGLSIACMQELQEAGIDVFTGGNHIWDKKDIFPFLEMENSNVLRPHNYPQGVVGSGIYRGSMRQESFAILNLMGHFGMPQCDNAFICANQVIESLHQQGIVNIVLDFHAEATSEKRAMFMMLKGKIGAIVGTHTHVGTDDLEIFDGTFGVSDIGMCGARESVIGMNAKEPIERFLTGLPNRLEVPKDSRIPSVFQMIVCEIVQGQCVEAFKLKAVDNGGLQKTLKAVKDS